MTVLGLLFAALIGLSLGLLGGGGSALAVPIFVYVLHFGVKAAIASSLAVVGVTSFFGAAEHWREGHVRLRAALVFGPIAAAGGYVGAKYLAGLFSGAAQFLLFAVVMAVAAFFMFREKESDEQEEDVAEDSLSSWDSFLLLVMAAAVGVLTGLVGVGGGFLIVPVLVVLAKMPMKAAVGTSLAVISMTSVSGFVGYLGTVEIRWGLVAGFIALAVAGSFAGAYLVRFVPQDILQRSFAVFLVVMAAFVLYQNREAIPFL
jgi:uncharacterized membrane protein YfcA